MSFHHWTMSSRSSGGLGSMSTSVVTSSLANKQILMIREDDMAPFIAEHA